MADEGPLGPDEAAAIESVIRALGVDRDDVGTLLSESGGDIPVDLMFYRRATMTARQLAQRSGLELDAVRRIYRQLGVPIDDLDAVAFEEPELGFLDLFIGAGKGFVPAEARDDLLRVLGSSLGRMADSTITAYVQSIEAPLQASSAPLTELLDSVLVGLELLDGLAAAVPSLLNHHFRQGVMRQRRAQEQVSSRLMYRFAVGFVDLVGFTALSQELDPSELDALVRTFENRAFEVAEEQGGRIVKHIGDEVMFTAPDPEAGREVALGLLGGLGDELIRPRGGLAFGEMLSRGGDHYGPVVNLAARLADAAAPDEILCDSSIHEALGDRPDLEPSGRRVLKGFPDPVVTWSLRPV